MDMPQTHYKNHMGFTKALDRKSTCIHDDMPYDMAEFNKLQGMDAPVISPVSKRQGTSERPASWQRVSEAESKCYITRNIFSIGEIGEGHA